jgi:hypothetical protein
VRYRERAAQYVVNNTQIVILGFFAALTALFVSVGNPGHRPGWVDYRYGALKTYLKVHDCHPGKSGMAQTCTFESNLIVPELRDAILERVGGRGVYFAGSEPGSYVDGQLVIRYFLCEKDAGSMSFRKLSYDGSLLKYDIEFSRVSPPPICRPN